MGIKKNIFKNIPSEHLSEIGNSKTAHGDREGGQEEDTSQKQKLYVTKTCRCSTES